MGIGVTFRMGIKQLEKDQLSDLMKRLVTITNLKAFRVEHVFAESDPVGYLAAKQPSLEEFGRKQAEGIMKMGLIKATGLDAVEQALRYSHWEMFEDLRIERPDGKTLRFGVVNCSTRKFMEKCGWQLKCGGIGITIRQKFVETIDPRARLREIFSAEDGSAHDGFNCMWEVTLDGE